MNDFLLFLKESRHIFSICPECGVVHRLGDLRLSTKGRYKTDWLDKIQTATSRWEDRYANLEDRRSELTAKAKLLAERRELPKLLRKIVPTLAKHKIDPRDVRTVFNPIEFVVFDGMHKKDVQRVSLLTMGDGTGLLPSMEATIKAGEFGWNTIRLSDDGSLSQKQGGRRRRPAGFDPAFDCPRCNLPCGNSYNLAEHICHRHPNLQERLAAVSKSDAES